ncbi:hypothetical protein CYMTET_21122 [Cymbomonas tetramitiformis]|uniref:Uncharacterized protein n=1 Tax=Cymbomonas tetramitiformis TaxID=36881 RepID=A0AAE0L3A3_9CHLO|nr:hypothetical protein CYMTET_21122 [Cymbomonas tetramitiformis]
MTSSPESGAITELKSLLVKAVSAVPDHDVTAKALYNMLTNAPDDAHIWDVLGLTLKASRGCGLPPAVGGVPGKTLIAELHKV